MVFDFTKHGVRGRRSNRMSSKRNAVSLELREFYEELEKRLPSAFEAMPPDMRRWIINRALDPESLREFETPPPLEGGGISPVCPKRGKISAPSACHLAAAFNQFPDLAPALWIWARTAARNRMQTRKGRAGFAYEWMAFFGTLMRGQRKPRHKEVIARLEAKHGGRGWDATVKRVSQARKVREAKARPKK